MTAVIQNWLILWQFSFFSCESDIFKNVSFVLTFVYVPQYYTWCKPVYMILYNYQERHAVFNYDILTVT